SAPNVCVVKVPDKRVEELTNIFNPKKKTPAEIVFEDYVGIAKDGSKKKESIFSEDVKQADALVHVCRAFEDETVPHPANKVDALDDAETFELELIMSDLVQVDNKLERLEKEIKRKKTPELEAEFELMQKLKATLEEEKPLRTITLNDEEKKIIRGYCFMSIKPMMLLLNIGEDQLGDKELVEKLEVFAKSASIGMQALCGAIEMEIAQMSDEDQIEFLQEYGITESARDIFIRKTYEMMGLIAFFTVGEDEVRAWTITKGTDAPNAAGVIHSDLQRGFIRAETVSYDDFMTVQSLAKAREKGMLRQEGKTYIVKDGDIINIKFNV
ncbi:MAG: redox-regulated ATPase YchF, partial [Vampirovibrionia bacterium]